MDLLDQRIVFECLLSDHCDGCLLDSFLHSVRSPGPSVAGNGHLPVDHFIDDVFDDDLAGCQCDRDGVRNDTLPSASYCATVSSMSYAFP